MKEKIRRKGIKKRLFSVVLALAMIISLMPMTGITVYAGWVNYLPETIGGYGATWAGNWEYYTEPGDNTVYCKDHGRMVFKNGDVYQSRLKDKNGNVVNTISAGTYYANCGTAGCTGSVTFKHVHNSKAYGSNATQHWTKCTDDDNNNGTPTNHTWENGKCTICQYTCSHTGGTATCMTKKVCVTCGSSYGDFGSHDFSYSAEDNVLTATCSRSNDHIFNLTLTANSPDYSGNAATITIGAETEKTAWTGAGLTVPTIITYAKADGTLLTAEPTAVGDYVAKVSPFGVDPTAENTAKVSYTISKAEPTATAPTAASSLTYTGEAQNLIIAGSTSHGTLQYAVNTTQTQPADSAFTTNIPRGTAVGTYYVYYKVVGNDEHSDKVFETPVTVSIGKGTIPDAKKPTSGKKVYVSSDKTTAQTGTVTLDTLGISTTDIPGAAIKDVTENTDDNNIISSISSTSYTTDTNLTAGHTATLTVTIESTNYTDFTYDLTVEVKAKTELTICQRQLLHWMKQRLELSMSRRRVIRFLLR